ncbi:MAG: HAD family hydrolase [Candidatus Aminicenantales bacterium]|jgi:D-glycero-D-manno-heptose 1,7-bisphosphate phosphatase
MRKRRAVFIDRDGTLNRDIGYPGHWSQVHVYPYAFEAVRRIRAAGLAAVVVTNQSGVGRGCFSEDELQELHREFGAAFEKQRAALDGFFYCPHYPRPAAAAPAAGCSCAKPGPSLGFRAAAELGLSLEGSYMVGDKADDVHFGLNIGAVPILVLTGYGRKALRDLETGRGRPAHVAENLAAATDWIIEREKRAARISSDHDPRKRSGHDPV